MYSKIVFKNFPDYCDIKTTCEILHLLEETVDELEIRGISVYSNPIDKKEFIIRKTKTQLVVEWIK